jgi:hypothetical protein
LTSCFTKLSRRLAVNVFNGKDLSIAFEAVRKNGRNDLPIRIDLEGKQYIAILTLDRIFALIDGVVYRAEYHDHQFRSLDGRRQFLATQALRYLTILDAGLV